MLISVCVCTFKRPSLLSELLLALRGQTFSDGKLLLELVVVDNDPAHSAKAVMDAWTPHERVVLRYFHVPVPNIAVARNAAIGQAKGQYLAFIDDDEQPQADWVQRLLDALQRFDADAALGPVLPRYRSDCPAWIRHGGFFDRPRFLTGTSIDEGNARTGNVLMRADTLHAMTGPFDVSFGLTGGEDSLLFRDLLAQGKRLIWCDEAPVSEEVPADRANPGWLLRRSYRVGQTWIRAELYRLSPLDRFGRGAAIGMRAVAQLGLSLALAVGCLPFSRVRAFKWLRTACAQAGKITGMTRFQYREYGA
jgi:succinoglycan biosynthesis protein ExoM